MSDDDIAKHPACSAGTSNLIPTCWHCDGMQIFAQTEYYMFTYRSLLSSGDLWDMKLFLGAFPHWMATKKETRSRIEAAVLKFAAWSMQWCERGIHPDVGYDGKRFPPKYVRGSRANTPLAGGYRMCYVANCMDGKAFRETNSFLHHAKAECVCHFCFAMMPDKCRTTPAEMTFNN